MLELLFTSCEEPVRLRNRVLEVLTEAVNEGGSTQIDMHVMAFSFTDRQIACRLEEIARDAPNVTVRVIADWSQGGQIRGGQVTRLSQLRLENLIVRYKKDQPYFWDQDQQRVCWSYQASQGMLHHKTLGIFFNGRPWKLVCGSSNWTQKAWNSYENLLVIGGEDAREQEIMRRMELEFETLWCDGQLTLSPEEAAEHYRAIIEEYRTEPSKDPSSLVGLSCGAGACLELASCDVREPACSAVDANKHSQRPLIAFGASGIGNQAKAGFSAENRAQRFEMNKPSGRTKRVPVTLTTVALETIARAHSNETLKVAMYGLSNRVAEYNALLDAARRGAEVRVLLDKRVGRGILHKLTNARRREKLPILVRAGRRVMHQKYAVHADSNTLFTGTANLSTEAACCHAEHRILFRHEPQIAERFERDFDHIWQRVSAVEVT